MLNLIGKRNTYQGQKTETIHKTSCLCDFVADIRLLHYIRKDG